MSQVCTFDGATQLDGQVICLRCGHPCQVATIDTVAIAAEVVTTGGWITTPKWRTKTQPERQH